MQHRCVRACYCQALLVALAEAGVPPGPLFAAPYACAKLLSWLEDPDMLPGGEGLDACCGRAGVEPPLSARLDGDPAAQASLGACCLRRKNPPIVRRPQA